MRRIATVGELLTALRRDIGYLAYKTSRYNNLSVLLEQDDLINEMEIEICICWDRYAYSAKDDEELLRVARAMLRYRLGELIHMHHGTHRKDGDYSLSLSDDDELAIPSVQDIPLLYEASERLSAFLGALSKPEADIVKAILDENDPRMILWTKVHDMRRSAVYASPTIKITPDLVADALHLDRSYVHKIFKTIRYKWRNYYAVEC